MEESKRLLTPQEKLFCACYGELGSPSEAALAAGYPKAEALQTALTLLAEPEILRLVKKHRRSRARLAKNTAKDALRRLAFGSSNDAARLALSEEIPPELDSMDLFGVSEIKKVKGGGVEIKLVNRLEAIRLLYELESETGGHEKADSFFNALKNTPAVLTEGDEVGGSGGI